MSEHYYSKKTEAKSEQRSWPFTLRGNEFTFTTDHAVFSKKEVDYGSRLLIDSFTEPAVTGELLDLGCGYGPIGLALAAAFPERQVQMVDVNERALELARHNALQNSITNVRINESDRFQAIEDRVFAAIVTNPPIRAGKQVVHAMFTEAKSHLIEGGEIWVVIQKKQGAPSAKKKLEEVYGECEVIAKEKGYYILKAKTID
ncbi:class I SAM-dependent methyltransferase [Halobacillus salinarum]|uniref:Class I SAM-dependent methyltransferase n=1 Tax=Halobacillus salinarum TaxID=2932257 RepID=A0ABY4EL89_9BACI|nr:class I SAM-dependent methyltransferase [Halobacillus salinarum]UOQ44628.1 class I SAM-dependent methyltransferase [Halobacillus salinarum]